MEKVPLPNLKTISEDTKNGIFEISPLYPGYGPTIANALRRVLLTSLAGAAVDSIKIDGVEHEFSTIKGVKEDVVEIILNLKSLRVKIQGDEDRAVLNLEKSQAGEVTAADFEVNSNVEILDKNHKIATLDNGGKLNLTVALSQGRSYQSAESKEHEKEIGVIVVDSFFSPVRHVAFDVENTRVGQATDYDKVTLTVETDGSIAPRIAIQESAKVLAEHYALISNIDVVETMNQVRGELEKKIENVKENTAATNEFQEDPEITPPLDPKSKIEDIPLSGRTKNALLASGYKTLSGLKRLSEIKLAGIKGLGAKGLEEVTAILKRIED